jgi:hypothetical protein
MATMSNDYSINKGFNVATLFFFDGYKMATWLQKLKKNVAR